MRRTVLLLAVLHATSAYAAPAQVLLRAKAHEATYFGVLEVVGQVGGREQYRLGPDTIVLGVDVRADDGALRVRFTLDLGEGDPTSGEVEYSERGLGSDQWRPTLEMLTLTPFFPLPAAEQSLGGSWTQVVSYQVPEIDLEVAEATRFRIDAIEGDLVTISFSAEGGGSTTLDRPQLGAGATMDLTRHHAREGTFVFDVAQGRVVSSERLELLTTESVFHTPDGTRDGPTESQRIVFRLAPARSPG